MNVTCDHDGDLEVAQSLDLCKRLRVFVYPLLDVFHADSVECALSKAARLALIFGVNDYRQRDSFKDRTDKAPGQKGGTRLAKG